MEESERAIEVGDVVRDNYGRVGVVMSSDPSPLKGWIAAQLDVRVRDIKPGERWFTVYPFSGGSALSPERLTTWLRRMTHEDFAAAYRGANGFAQDKLDAAFPENASRKSAAPGIDIH